MKRFAPSTEIIATSNVHRGPVRRLLRSKHGESALTQAQIAGPLRPGRSRILRTNPSMLRWQRIHRPSSIFRLSPESGPHAALDNVAGFRETKPRWLKTIQICLGTKGNEVNKEFSKNLKRFAPSTEIIAKSKVYRGPVQRLLRSKHGNRIICGLASFVAIVCVGACCSWASFRARNRSADSRSTSSVT